MKQEQVISDVNNITRRLVKDHLNKHGITLSKFCKDAKLYHSNIYMFLNGGSINTRTIEKIGKYLKETL
jgi:predicted transcriptional regulator